MTIKQFTVAEQEAFWAGAHVDAFKADIIADPILSTALPYLGADVLDIGAGSGALMRRFSKRFGPARRIIGVDMTPQGEGVLKADCARLPFPDASFDTCIATDLIEHLSDSSMNAFLREMLRVLKPSGCAVITTVNDEKIEDSMMTCPECRCRFHRWGHCRVFTPDKVREMFRDGAFSLVWMRTVNFGLLSRYGVLARAAYAIGIDRLYRTKTFNCDLIFILQKK